jgi:hypothetical protein
MDMRAFYGSLFGPHLEPPLALVFKLLLLAAASFSQGYAGTPSPGLQVRSPIRNDRYTVTL